MKTVVKSADIPTHKYGLSRAYISARRIKMDPRYPEVAHRHNFYQILFIEEGGGCHEIDFEKYKTKSGSFHFVGKGRVHRVDFSKNTMGDVFTFPEELFSSSETEMALLNSLLFFRSGSVPILQPKPAELKNLMPVLEQIRVSLKNDSLDVSKFLFFAFLGKLRDIYGKLDSPIAGYSEEYFAFRNALKLVALENNSVEDLANKMKIQLSRLNQICKKESGKTALQLLHEHKVLGAKRMLVYTSKQIKEISLECGFNDVAYFNRFFKKHTGNSPSQFRALHKQMS